MFTTDEQAYVKTELAQAIAYFIQRQGLVAQAITDLGLDVAAIGRWGTGAWTWHAIDDRQALRTTLATLTNPDHIDLYTAALRAAELRVPQQGIWYDQGGEAWTYYFHGMGCRLTHQTTGEEIDWDCPNVYAFDPFFFEPHLAWQLSTASIIVFRRHLIAWVQQHGLRAVQTLIDELIDEGVITPEMTLASSL